MCNHDFDKTPAKEEIIYRLRKMQEFGAYIPKIAVMPQTVGDLLILLDATYTMKTEYADRPFITMSMSGYRPGQVDYQVRCLDLLVHSVPEKKHLHQGKFLLLN